MDEAFNCFASIDAQTTNVIFDALCAASCTINGNPETNESLWTIVSRDSLASSYFLKSLSNSLGFELPSSLLRCTKLAELVERVQEYTAEAGEHRRHKITVPTLNIQGKKPSVAVVSASCRLPGGVETLGDLWSDILQPGKDAITPIPKERWDADLIYHPQGGEGTSYVREGGFVENADAFDNRFFEIPDSEAAQMDPQQRHLLEAAFEAKAPLTKNRRNPSVEIGVFIGCSCADWLLVHAKLPSRDGPSCFIADLQHAMLANRISYCLNLEGASMTIDTATSSGIVAFCTAVNQLESGRMICALAGSSQLIIAPDVTVALCSLGMLSRTGRCRPFDEAADGFIRSEGVIVFSLIREDYISELVDTSAVQPLAFVRGHAVVHCGRAFSTTAPSEGAERRAIEGALAKASMLPDNVDYIEAHGTGTRMGDAVEFQSLAAVFGDSHEPGRPLLVGSIKGNIGHCEGSSGGAGICKAILVLINHCVPATLHFNRLSSLIDRTPGHFLIPRATLQLPDSNRPLVVGVSSFGVGGCNGHVILEGPKESRHDFRAQLNDKCTWKRNRFPWSHLITLPRANIEACSSANLNFPHDGAESPVSSLCRTASSPAMSPIVKESSHSSKLVSTGLSTLGLGSHWTDLRWDEHGHQEDFLRESSLPHRTKTTVLEKSGAVPLGHGEVSELTCSISKANDFHSTTPTTQGRQQKFAELSAQRLCREQIKPVVEESLKLALKREETFDEKTPFWEVGVDSLTSIGIREILSKKLQIQLPATILYDHPCVAELVKYLEQELSLSVSEEMQTSYGVQHLNGLSYTTGEVAVVSFACRFPPQARCGSDFWNTLQAGHDCIQHIPLSRFDVWKYCCPIPSQSDALYVRDAGVFPDMSLFDNTAFNISTAEAQLMDPHQRVLLEVCRETLTPVLETSNPLDVAIIVGCCNNDWVRETCISTEKPKSLSATGEAASIVSNRLSYAFNLHGPSMTIDTACSSSLVALHVAKELLNDRRHSASLAAGVHILVNHHVFEHYCKAGMLSVDGRCKTFDASANGYVRSEGCGAVLLKSLPRDSTEPSTVYAWIRGAANNHVGRSASLTAPNGPAQQSVIRAALQNARVQSPAEVCVLETHGTGTSLGDPIEVGAIRAVYCSGFADCPPLILGALKSLMGHAEGAAGIAGLIKLILVLQHRMVTPNLHLNTLNPHIDLTRGDKYRDLLFPSKCVPLDSLLGIQDSQSLLGAVSSFGFGGSNAHAIVEVEPVFNSRWTNDSVWAGGGSEEDRATVVWLFSGQGSQYLDMACAYFRHNELFRDTISACTNTLKKMSWFSAGGPQSIEDLVYGAESDTDRRVREELLSQTQYSQVAVFAIELALSKVLLERGLKPDIVIGHSLGEYAAATVAGVLGWEDALCLVAKRASLLAAQPRMSGIMVACRLSASTVQTALATDLQDLQAVSLAADNGPQSVTIAGTKEQVDKVLEYLGVAPEAKRLQVSHAFHSPLMAGAVQEMEALVSSVPLQPASIAIASTVRGRMLEPSEAQDPRYWAEQLTQPVRFREAVEAAVAAATSKRLVFVEVGPQRTLANLARQIVGELSSASAQYYVLAKRDGVGESVENLESRLEQISFSSTSRARYMWNHKKFPFLFQGMKQPVRGSRTTKRMENKAKVKYGSLWKIEWRNVSLPEAQEEALSDAVGKWLFCGVPKEHIFDFSSLLRSSGINEAAVIQAGGLLPDAPLPNLPCGQPAAGILFVSGLWSFHSSTSCANDLRQVLLAYCKSAEIDPKFSPPVCVVTGCSNSSFGLPCGRYRESHAGDGEIRHSGLLGMCRTARLEIQRLCKRPFRMLFINVEKGESSFERVWSWINAQFGLLSQDLSVSTEEDIVISSRGCMVPRLIGVSTSQSKTPIAVSSSKSYLITGGTGGLGLAVAEWLLKKGAGLVVLLSRSGKPAEALMRSTTWKAVEKGIASKRAEVILGDVASRPLVFETLSRVHQRLRLGGLFHCAGFEGESSLINTSFSSIQSVYEPKAQGAWNLHSGCQQLNIEEGLDMFILFSSISVLPGNDALAPYAAANAYLDSLAYWRRSQGLRAQSIQWGPWIDVGMVTRHERFKRVFESRGIQPFRTAEGIAVMEKAMKTDEPCICALVVDWEKYSQVFGKRIPMALAELAGAGQPATISLQGSATARSLVETAVLEAASSLANKKMDLSSDTPLDELGLDSLGFVELRNIIQERLGISLPASLLLEFSSLGEAVEYITEDLNKRPSVEAANTVSVPKRFLSETCEDGIAVIGMGCRLPGNSNSPEEFWKMLVEGTDCISDIPWQRFNIQPLFDPDPEENKCYVKEAALLNNAHLFDNEFFRMSENQARNIDPQQRVLLEVAYETFVDARYQRESLKGQDIGVFCATYTNEYQLSSLTKGENGILAVGEGADGGVPRLKEASGYPEPGGLLCLIPNRISYALGLIGPSIGVDTACASGLVALDTAMMKLRLSGCSKAFVGAVSLILAPCFFLGGSKTRQFSKSGRCRTFDAEADGLVRGEGAAGVLLAPVRTARTDSQFVHAVVRGTATSHYGQGARLTAPNTRALSRVLNLALEDGGVEQSLVRCYEAHGTATVLGDIIEMSALKQVFENRSASAPLIVGTAHNNIGHLDSAAALVAFIKTVLTLKNRYVPPNIQFNKLHPDIGVFDQSKIIYTKEGQHIHVHGDQIKIFGANLAYGLGGTVVAAITEEGDDPHSAPTATRHMWKHNSFPLDSQKFIFLLGSAAELAQDRRHTPKDDVKYLLENLYRNSLSEEKLRVLGPATAPELVSTIFLTGATGLTGSQILRMLLEQKVASEERQICYPRIYCLVKARDRMHAMYRIVDAVVGRGQQWKPRYFEQVLPVVGDLTAPRLGLSHQVFETLANEVEAVYHAGRVVNYALPYEAIRKANVLSLQPLIELCTMKKSKHLHVLSDFAAHIQYFAAFSEDLNRPLTEDLSVPHDLMERMENQMPPSVVGYPWTRWALEEVLAKCQLRINKLANSADSAAFPPKQFSFSVYRLPNSAVYFNNGRVEFSNPFFAITSAALQQGIVPPGVLPVGPAFLTTPIDISAEILVTISRASILPSVIHIVNPVGIRRDAITQAISALGICFKECGEDHFLRGIEKNQNGSPAYPLLALMRFWRKYWFSNDLDRNGAFPIETTNMEACIPTALKKFPEASDVWARMAAYCLKNYHLVRDPYDNIFPRSMLERILTHISTSYMSTLVSNDTLQILKTALQQDGNEELDKALEWKSEHFISNPICSFLPPFQ